MSGGSAVSGADPGAAYTARLRARQAAADRLARAERALSVARGVVFALGAVLWWLAVGPRLLAPGWIGLVFLVFLALIVVHDRVIRSRQRVMRAVELYQRGLARLEDRWVGVGEDGHDQLDPQHPYAEDLDLFGPASLFQRLGAPRTRMGQQTLAAWLGEPAAPAEVAVRQQAIAELRPRLDFREDLALVGHEVRVGLDPDALVRWAEAPPAPFPRLTRPFGLLLSSLSLTSLVSWFLLELGPGPFLIAVLVQLAMALPLQGRVSRVVRGVDRPGRELQVLAEVLRLFEGERFGAPRLVASRAALDAEGQPPSRCIARLSRRLELLESQRNMFFAPLAALLLWETQLALEIESWRRVCGSSIRGWLRAVGELEALSAVAGYAFENPGDPFPEVVEEGPLFDAEALGHPLLPSERCVRNDLRLDPALQVLVVSGSNMSGKTTLLRSVGVNTALALAGAPVRARRLRLSALAVGASIRVHDSLQDGTSRFYAEITRVRQLMDLAGAGLPLLFLLDEVLHGTNSGDRRVGAEAIVRGLLGRGAIGLVTTHDLALAELAEGLAPQARNVHFEDHLEGDRIAFDYRLRPGVVRKSNALALMRAVGLDV